jgi:hypothetical protein
LNLSEAHPKGLPISEAATKISYDVCGLGDFLGDIDRRWNRQRDDALAAAFPTSGFNGDESRLRFGTQFVGALKQGKLTGLPAGLRFIVCDTSKDSRVTLTKAGAAFARLENPSLDFKPNVPISRLSKEEVRFLLDHIKCAVPEELAAYIAIIDGIEEGAKTPHELDKYLAQKFSLDLVSKAESPDQITETFLTSQRTGAVSRMVDLDLVFREKKGLHVTYVVTHPGKYFRSQMK